LKFNVFQRVDLQQFLTLLFHHGAAAAAAPIDSLFRLLGRDENQLRIPQPFSEFELLPHLTLEAILATGITWDSFRRFLINKVVRMARGGYVCSEWDPPYGSSNRVLALGVLNDSGRLYVDVRPGTATDTVMATCNFLVRLLAASEKRNVYINGGRELLPVSDPTLSHLFERSRESLIQITLACMILNEEHIRALAIAITPRHELRLVLQCCRLSDNNDACRDSFVQWLQSDGVPRC
jgi:hypothetical protein